MVIRGDIVALDLILDKYCSDEGSRAVGGLMTSEGKGGRFSQPIAPPRASGRRLGRWPVNRRRPREMAILLVVVAVVGIGAASLVGSKQGGKIA